MLVIATIDTAASIAGHEASQARELHAEADTYGAALTTIADQVPDGWKILHYRVPGRG
ncbi:hypothetical protein [Antribacter gilvus]|uniref:hypothetical protein n=1 Tax=Antribacter gilvus TaxID=2304675 RepID=UPI0013DF5A22|nr:hypothetical protein [Antribacter gilvus]